jgi:hypothetical protein
MATACASGRFRNVPPLEQAIALIEQLCAYAHAGAAAFDSS